MDREHDITNGIVNIDYDIGDQRSKKLLASTHRHIRSIPSR